MTPPSPGGFAGRPSLTRWERHSDGGARNKGGPKWSGPQDAGRHGIADDAEIDESAARASSFYWQKPWTGPAFASFASRLL